MGIDINITCKTSQALKNDKKRGYLQDKVSEMETNSKNNISDLCRSINEFKKE
jgi:hypothetical protein